MFVLGIFVLRFMKNIVFIGVINVVLESLVKGLVFEWVFVCVNVVLFGIFGNVLMLVYLNEEE